MKMPNTPSPNDTKGQKRELLAHLMTGNRITVLKALNEFGVYSLSQRLGELRRINGVPIKSRFITTATGKRIKEYWLSDDYLASHWNKGQA